MRRKLLGILSVFLFTSVFSFATPVQDFNLHMLDVLEPLMKESNSADLLEPVKKHFTLKIPVTKQFFPKFNHPCAEIEPEDSERLAACKAEVFPTTTACKAYALNDSWILAGGTCVWNGRHNVEMANLEYKTGLVEQDNSRPLKIDRTEIPVQNNLFIQPHAKSFPHVILVRVPKQYTSLTARLHAAPKMRILTFAQSNPFKLLQGTFFIHTARFGTNKIFQRTLLADSLKDGYVSVQEKASDFAGTSTDPLVFLRNGKLYWIGVNEGVTEVSYGNLLGDQHARTSAKYFYFTKKDKQFIEQTISEHDPQSWQEIAPFVKVDKL